MAYILAKPVLMVAIIDGIEANVFWNNQFVINDWLEGRYKMLMDLYAKDSQFDATTGMEKPFWHLESDGFWHLNYKGECLSKSRTPSMAWLKSNVEFAYFDEALWILLQNKGKHPTFDVPLIRLAAPGLDGLMPRVLFFLLSFLLVLHLFCDFVRQQLGVFIRRHVPMEPWKYGAEILVRCDAQEIARADEG